MYQRAIRPGRFQNVRYVRTTINEGGTERGIYYRTRRYHFFYGDDFKRDVLDTQLKTFPFVLSEAGLLSNAKNIQTFRDVRDKVKDLPKGMKMLISEVIKLLKLVIVMPATNAFSAMRRLFTYLRTTMKQNRLNNTMVLHVHKEKTDSLSLVDIANEFVKR